MVLEETDRVMAGGRPLSLFLDESNMAACTDLYQFTMAAGYFVHKPEMTATFEMFVRRLPRNRSYLVAAGLEQALHYLEHFHFSGPVLNYLRDQPVFAHVPSAFFEHLARLRFTGDVYAVAEGTVVFAEEPVLRVTAPVVQAQLVETYLLAAINFQTLVASKAARVVEAARGRLVADFGTRRAHGPQAGVLAARAACIGGCGATSNVLAGMECGIPMVGTAAHSYTMAFRTEQESFERYHQLFPDHTTLLIDTYDSVEGARKAARIGPRLKGVRLDSGDLDVLSRQVRAVLDQAGLEHVKIVASGDLNEYRISDLLDAGAPIDIFGVGTEMVTSRDDPAIGGVYKLVAVQEHGRSVPTVKLSQDKATYPCAKQVYRRQDEAGRFAGDVVTLDVESLEGEPLLALVMRGGKPLEGPEPIEALRRRCLDQVGRLPEAVRDVRRVVAYPVERSPALECALQEALARGRDATGP